MKQLNNNEYVIILQFSEMDRDIQRPVPCVFCPMAFYVCPSLTIAEPPGQRGIHETMRRDFSCYIRLMLFMAPYLTANMARKTKH